MAVSRSVVAWTILILSVSRFAIAADARPFGINKRVPWTASRFNGTPEPPDRFLIEPVFPKLSFENPVELLSVPGADRMLVVEVNGSIHTFRNTPDVDSKELVADLRKATPTVDGNGRRVYGFAFHPRFKQNHQVFICYLTKTSGEDGTRVSRFKASSVDPLKIDLKSEEVLITWLAGGHNGGSIHFGPRDGMLYISTGDGAPAFPTDIHRTGQDVGDLLASILRIDVDTPDGDQPYTIPNDNPFVELNNARGEVWSYGHRNPWRMSFDNTTGDLWVGDVGWEKWEMIYRVARGANYGWSLLEHTQPVNPELTRGPTPIVPPTAAHPHTESRSITGGYVYRGDRLPSLAGHYVYGDYVTGKLWGIKVDGEQLSPPIELSNTGIPIICFGQDHSGELFVVSYTGSLYRLKLNPNAGRRSVFPQRLSETGLFTNATSHDLSPGVIPYAINAEPWEDGTTARRFIALPGNSKLGVHDTGNVQQGKIKGEWSYPDGTILGKTISIDTTPDADGGEQRLETQILYRYDNGWSGYTFAWNESQSDADLTDGKGSEISFTIDEAQGGRRTQTWHSASRTECILCHTTRGGSVYGFRIDQLQRDFEYGSVTDNQLRTLAHIDLFEKPLTSGVEPHEAPLDKLPAMVDPYNGESSLTDRVRSYLHINCSHCHHRGGGGTAAFEVFKHIPFEKTRLIARPTQGTFGLVDAWVVAPGDPYRSILYHRMTKLGRGRMPHFGSQTVDVRGIRLVHDWIEQLAAPADFPTEGEQIETVSGLQTATESALLLLSGGVGVTEQLRTAAIDRLLSSTNGALTLVSVIRGFGRELDPAVHEQVIARGSKHADPTIRDLFEPFLPEEARVKRLGTSINTQELLAAKGNVDAGRTLFFESKSLQCRNCHRIGNKGKAVGPDLDGIAKRYSRAEILENIIAPSAKIDPKYQTILIQTESGRVLSGVLVEKSNQQVTLKDATGKLSIIPASEIELLISQKKSLMPELQLKDATIDEASDLLEFLTTLK